MQIVIQREVCSNRSSKSPVVYFFMCGLAVRAQPEGQKIQDVCQKKKEKEKKLLQNQKTYEIFQDISKTKSKK